MYETLDTTRYLSVSKTWVGLTTFLSDGRSCDGTTWVRIHIISRVKNDSYVRCKRIILLHLLCFTRSSRLGLNIKPNKRQGVFLKRRLTIRGLTLLSYIYRTTSVCPVMFTSFPLNGNFLYKRNSFLVIWFFRYV